MSEVSVWHALWNLEQRIGDLRLLELQESSSSVRVKQARGSKLGETYTIGQLVQGTIQLTILRFNYTNTARILFVRLDSPVTTPQLIPLY